MPDQAKYAGPSKVGRTKRSAVPAFHTESKLGRTKQSSKLGRTKRSAVPAFHTKAK